MATFDISRVAFDARKHYSSVRMQQGKVLTDDDYNEGRRIEDELQRRTQTDIIGRYGSPDDGFKIINWNPAGPFIDFDIHDGAIYLGGIRLEIEKTKDPANVFVYETFRLQRDWLQKDDQLFPFPNTNQLPAGDERFDLVYLECWQQPVCAVEDNSLFEVALGGPDTTTRIRNMRRVNIFENSGSAECPLSWKKLKDTWKTNHLGTINAEYERIRNIQLSVTYSSAGITDDLCSPSIQGGYLGAENQAIRVQLTSPGHFTWGFDNGSPYYRVKIGANGTTVNLLNLPRDQYHWPLTGQVVEILPWSAVLPNGEKIAEQSGFMSKVAASYNPDTAAFELATTLPANFGVQWKNRTDNAEIALPEEYFYLRVWNRGTDLASPAEIPYVSTVAENLGHTGLQVTISPVDPALPLDEVPEDFWVIAARPETPDVVVPWELKDGIVPMGVRRFFAPLAIIHWTNSNNVITGSIIHDCRKPFNPLTEDECCCTYSVGDGVYSKGDFRSIQEAVDNLPPQGGKICVLKGIHDANVLIRNKKQIHIMGCGDQTIVRPAATQATTPIFQIEHSQKIRIDWLTMVSVDGIAVQVEDPVFAAAPSEEIILFQNRMLAFKHAIRVNLQEDKAGDNNIKILYNQIGMFDKPNGDVAIFTVADDVLIERNRIIVIPAPPGRDPDDPQEDPPDDVTDPCADPVKIHGRFLRYRVMVNAYIKFVSAYVPHAGTSSYQTLGGIQVGCASERVWILENEIIGGKGTGILLGHAAAPPPGVEIFEIHYAPISEIVIEGNLIQLMGIAGISPFITPGSRFPSVIMVSDIMICRNKIQYCCLQLPRDERNGNTGSLAYGGIIMAFCEDGVIINNTITNNGRNHLEPICGIFILFGEKIDISSNRILHNGPRINAQDNQASPGFRGGIVIRSSFKSADMWNNAVRPIDHDKKGTDFASDAVPAVKVHDNIVTQPLGHALFVVAFGPVSVVSNQFTAHGVVIRDKFARLAGSVFIMNLGVSKDLLNIIWACSPALRSLPYNNPSTLIALQVDPNSPLGRALIRFQLLPSGRIMFVGNQTTLDLRNEDRSASISSQFILSLDDIAFNTNQSEVASFVTRSEKLNNATGDIVLINTILAGPSVRSNDNRFTDGFSLTVFSLFSLAFVNTGTDNQATHCLVIIGNPALEFEGHNIILIPVFCRDKKRTVGNHFGKKATVVSANP